ncbi:hypothetical protein ABK040_012103 [Willaertia magna]
MSSNKSTIETTLRFFESEVKLNAVEWIKFKRIMNNNKMNNEKKEEICKLQRILNIHVLNYLSFKYTAQ